MITKTLNPNQIITLNDYPIRSEQILKLYFRMSQKGGNKIVPPCPVIHKSLVVKSFQKKLKRLFDRFYETNPQAEYFLLDGSHKTTAAALAHKKILVMIFESNKDINYAKKLVKKGELLGLTTGNNITKAVEALKKHFNKTEKFQTVEEKTDRLIREDMVPKYMVKLNKGQALR